MPIRPIEPYCHGRGCLRRFECARLKDTVEGSDTFFSDEPFRVVDGKFTCDMFWGATQENIFKQLKDITDGKESGGTDHKGTDESENESGTQTKTD